MKQLKSLAQGLLMAACMTWLAACNSVSADGKEWVNSSDPDSVDEAPSNAEEEFPEDMAAIKLGVARQHLTGTHKLCSIFVPNNWRDTIEVGNGWTRTRCTSNWRTQWGASQARLGCITDSTFSFGPNQTTPPPDNVCGW